MMQVQLIIHFPELKARLLENETGLTNLLVGRKLTCW